MIRLTHDTPILIAVEPANFRSGIDGFAALTRERLGHDPRDGTLYVYTNRARTMIRALVYDGSGFWLMTKRLSRGRFGHWPRSHEPVAPATARALRALLDGGPWQPGAGATVGAEDGTGVERPAVAA